jgi:hypothetical protein
MSEQFDALQRRVSGLERRVLLLAMCCAALTIYLLLSAARGVVKAAAQPEMLTVKRLAVVDEKGTERVVIAAPLPDPIIQGKIPGIWERSSLSTRNVTKSSLPMRMRTAARQSG